MMNNSLQIKYFTLLISLLLFFIEAFQAPKPKPALLIFSKTAGWHHSSIPSAIAAITKIAEQKGYSVDTTTNAAYFNEQKLSAYNAVIFNSTTGNVLNSEQQTAFERYIQAGGGYVGIHSAADTEYDWSWYGQLIGAYFDSHPHNPNVREASIQVSDKSHPASSNLPESWTRSDEWYNYRSFYPGIKVLASLDEDSYDGGTNGTGHPIIWYHEYDGGRAFYTGLGHTEESYSEPLFLAQLAGGIEYALGNGAKLDYAKAYAKPIPEQNRFTKTILSTNLNSTMELAVSEDGRIFYTELFGNLYAYDTKTHKNTLVEKLATTNIGGTGLIGITLDPEFDKNNFIYLYYAPEGQSQEPLYFNLSRFSMSKMSVLDLSSEKILLRVPVEKNSGSHHGGSLGFDTQGNLYLSTGDSSSPFSSEGYAPLDERPGEVNFSGDAQRSAGNTNDFKGKILRIHPEADGTYSIPQGNLFKPGTPKTKPEIYVMGTRNPYRIALNPKSSTLYWGDIGPDAGQESERGPIGFDEVNQAKSAGNYGWPYFAGDNQAYAHWDFAKKTAGGKFDPEKPVNHSPNNTGLSQLPPARPAMIWYPYLASKEFPELGLGGRCIIGGTFYSYKQTGAPNRFPEYYDGKFFIADWMRNWVFALSFDEKENYVRNEPFMAANGNFKRPIDMAFSSDGILYMLEYGSVYGAANADASLVKIEYNTGNRAPVAKAEIINEKEHQRLDKTVFLTSERKNFPSHRSIAGKAPLLVNFRGQKSYDLDDDEQLSYQWQFEGKVVASNKINPVYTYKKPGTFKAILTVRDKTGASAKDTLIIKVGNTPPVVSIYSAENKSFFWADKPFTYAIQASDKEDLKIAPNRLKAFYTYLSTGQKNQSQQASYSGKALMAASDCKSCHLANAKAIGPSYFDIAARYSSQNGSVEKLAEKIIKGGGGSWGQTSVMSAHPQLSTSDAKEIVTYIFSMPQEKTAQRIALAKTGTLKLNSIKDEPEGGYLFQVSYTDGGRKPIGPLSSTEEFFLRSPVINPALADAHVGFERFRNSLFEGDNKAYILLKQTDLNGIKNFTFNYASTMDGEIEVRRDSRAGPLISKISYNSTGSFDKYADILSPISSLIKGRHDLYFIIRRRQSPYKGIIKLGRITFGR
ncbi:MAG: carbohydrate-binding protein [Pedobacter sp.]|nr:MAG: carbohydrate-binding protein [Pedobacter sp.]